MTAELRRIGSSADETIIDRYVAQHYDSFAKAMDRQQPQTKAGVPSTHSANGLLTPPQDSSFHLQGNDAAANVSAFRSSPPTGPSSAPHLLSNDGQADQSINPHLMELSSVHQPFTVSRLPSTGDKPSTMTGGSPASSKGKYRDQEGDDDMSEDEDEDDKDTLADLVNDLKASSAGHFASPRTLQEETPIAGSIMGPANELRPDPEAYRKLSSKEKRQLRNKISARNFRTRRKEHISHLEQQVADRDTVIDGLRQQLALVSLQNKELNEEMQALKTKSISNADVSRIIEALQKGAVSTSSGSGASNSDMGPPSHLLRSASNSSLSDTFNNGRPSTPSMLPSSPRSNSPRPLITRPNMRKDLSSSSNANASKSFWGGVGGTGNNFMSVHTVLVPHLPGHTDALDAKVNLSTARPRPTEETATLSKLISEKLTITEDMGKEKKADGMREADVNEALVSLLDEDVLAPPPPSYSQAVGERPSIAGLDLSDERMNVAVLGALQKAFSLPVPSKAVTASGSGWNRLDASKIQALLDGRATLVLYDEEKGQVWNGCAGESSHGTSSHSTPSLTPAVHT